MQFSRKLLPSLVAASAISLIACHDDNSHSNTNTPIPVSSTKTITVTPSLGKISKGRIQLKNAFTKAIIASAKNIEGNGTATFTVDANKLLDPIIAEVLPATDGKLEYADEAITGKLVSISGAANTAILRAASSITANNTNLGVTALTEASLTYAQSLSAQLTKANIEAANQKIQDQLKLTKFNITDAPAVIGLNDFSPLLSKTITEQQRAYAAYLATLAKESKRINASSTQPAYDILQAFSQDFSDGVFDAKQGSTPLTVYNNSFIQAWANWVTTFYASLFKLQNAADLTAWLNAFNAQTPNIPTPTPINPTPTTETCASKKLPTTTLSSIVDYNGDYKDQGATVFNLTISTAKATVKTTTANIQQVCGPNVQGNGTNHVLITDKGSVTLFKDNAGVYSAEGLEFADTSKVFFGTKAGTVTATLCESSGADDKLGFKNAPSDFCSFTKASSVAITSPDIYTFFNADKQENVKITVNGTVVKSVQIENNKYAWACGIGTFPACTNATFTNSNANFAQVAFQNTVLKVVNGTTQDLTIKSGAVIHLKVTTPAPTGSCVGNTNPYGCLTITGSGAPATYYEHIANKFLFNGGPQVLFNPLDPTTGAVSYFGNPYGANTISASVSINFLKGIGAFQDSTYNFVQYDSNKAVAKQLTYVCKEANGSCPGLTVDTNARTMTYNNVIMKQIYPVGTTQLTFNGTMKF